MENLEYGIMFLISICGGGALIAALIVYGISQFGKKISETEARKLVAQAERTKAFLANNSRDQVNMMTVAHLSRYIEELEKAQQEHERIAAEIKSLQQVNNAIYKGI